MRGERVDVRTVFGLVLTTVFAGKADDDLEEAVFPCASEVPDVALPPLPDGFSSTAIIAPAPSGWAAAFPLEINTVAVAKNTSNRANRALVVMVPPVGEQML